MTYNFDDWQVGDLAWITSNDDSEYIVVPEQMGRQLRMLVRRTSAGQSTSSHTGRTSTWRVGSHHWVNLHGMWIRADSPHHLILDAERAIAVTPDQANWATTRQAEHETADPTCSACAAIARAEQHTADPGPPPHHPASRGWAV